MIDLNEKIMREMNRYLDGTTMEEILVRILFVSYFCTTKLHLPQRFEVPLSQSRLRKRHPPALLKLHPE